MFVFFLLCSSRKTKNRMTADSGLKKLQRSDTKCLGQGRQCGSMSNILCDEEPAYESKQYTHKEREREREREREIGTKNKLYFWRQQLQKTITTTTFTEAIVTTITFTKVTRSLYIVTNLRQLPFMLFT